MAGDLEVSGDALSDAARRFGTLAAGFDIASEEVRAALDAVGESPVVQPLRATLENFERGWSERREGLRSELLTLADVLRQVDESFEQADSALREAVTPVPRQTGPGHQVK